jgi:hypothetical protein
VAAATPVALGRGGGGRLVSGARTDELPAQRIQPDEWKGVRPMKISDSEKLTPTAVFKHN